MADVLTISSRITNRDPEVLDKATGNIVQAFRNAAGSMMALGAADALTAHAGGGQANGLALTSQFNRVTTVASAADSVVLPAATVGLFVVVANAAALNSMDVYPATGDAINALAANAAFAVAADKTALFVCMAAGQWMSILTA